MSASLVGSEMCIRDRIHTFSKSCKTTELGSTGRAAGQLPHSVSPGPVSYTHLTLPTICSV
eukprot:8781546-Alexandrium_andersonii.AAC.1